MDRSLQLLGIAKKAGLLAIGGEAASAAARSGMARAIISARDASDGAKRRAKRDAEFCGAAYVAAPYTMSELGSITGRGSPGTMAFLDKGLAMNFLEKLTGEDTEKLTGEDAGEDTGEDAEEDTGRYGEREKTTGKRRTAQ